MFDHFILPLQFVVMEVFLVALYFLTYDNADMRPEEEINFPSIVNQLTDPEIVTRNIIANLVITAGTVSSYHACKFCSCHPAQWPAVQLAKVATE